MADKSAVKKVDEKASKPQNTPDKTAASTGTHGGWNFISFKN